MPQLGESIAIALIRLEEGKCVFCGKSDHAEIKKDVIKATGWKRKKISGVGGRFSGDKLNMYPMAKSPPSAYRAEGHHCLAFSSFIMGAQSDPPDPKDRFAALNHYLKEKSYDPNNESNTIDLPGRKKTGDTDEHAQFKEFAKAVKEGKPLQLHIGGHVDKFMNASNNLIRGIVRAFQQNKLCEKPDDEFKNKLLKKIEDAEDKAFRKTAGANSPWICHPAQLKKAEAHVKKTQNVQDVSYPQL